MAIFDLFKKLWASGISNEEQIRKLIQQIEVAIQDLKIKIGESLAIISDIQRRIDEQKEKIQLLDPDLQAPELINAEEKLDYFSKSLANENSVCSRLKEILNDLSDKKDRLNFSLQQSLNRIRNAETINQIADLKRDFGDEMRLNNYLNKLGQESLKLEFTADSRLKIEMALASENGTNPSPSKDQ